MQKKEISKRQFLKQFNFDDERLNMYSEDNTLIVGMRIKMIRIPKSLIDLTRKKGVIKSGSNNREYNHLSIVYALMLSMNYEYYFDKWKFSVHDILNYLGYAHDTKNINLIRNTIKILVEKNYIRVIDDLEIIEPDKLKPSKYYYVRSNDNFKKFIYTSFAKLLHLRKNNVFNSKIVQLYNVYMEMLSYYYFSVDKDKCLVATNKFFDEFTSIRDNDTKLKILCNLTSMHLMYIKTGGSYMTTTGIKTTPYFVAFPMKSKPNYKWLVNNTMKNYNSTMRENNGFIYDSDFHIAREAIRQAKRRLTMLKKNNASDEDIQQAEKEVEIQTVKLEEQKAIADMKRSLSQQDDGEQYGYIDFESNVDSDVETENTSSCEEYMENIDFENFETQLMEQADYFKSLGATMTREQMRVKIAKELDDKLCKAFRESGLDVESDESGDYKIVDKSKREENE